jgi:hypothetical protein
MKVLKTVHVAGSNGGIAAPAISTTVTVNGTRHGLTLDPRPTLLDLLREHLDLTGAKKGCIPQHRRGDPAGHGAAMKEDEHGNIDASCYRASPPIGASRRL